MPECFDVERNWKVGMSVEKQARGTSSEGNVPRIRMHKQSMTRVQARCMAMRWKKKDARTQADPHVRRLYFLSNAPSAISLHPRSEQIPFKRESVSLGENLVSPLIFNNIRFADDKEQFAFSRTTLFGCLLAPHHHAIGEPQSCLSYARPD